MLQREKKFIAVLLLVLVGYASAANTAWTGSVNTDWFNTGNWDTGAVPASTDATFVNSFGGSAIINASGAQTAYLTIANGGGHTTTLILESGSSLDVVGLLTVGQSGDGTLINNGGTVNVTTDGIYLGAGVGGKGGTIIMNSGTINSFAQFEIGRQPTLNPSLFVMNGGTVNITDDIFGLDIALHGVGHVDFFGGQIIAGAFSMQRGTGTGSMDITGGVLRVIGDVTAKIAAGIAGTQGTITAYGGAGTVMYDYDVTNPGETTVTATPGPVVVPQTASLLRLWKGTAKLDDAQQINISGTTRIGDIKDPGRFTVIQVGSDIYAFFRQQVDTSSFEIYRAVSTDNGLNFAIEYNPVIAKDVYFSGVGNLTTVYDPDIIKYGGKYYLAFEGSSPANGYNVSSFIAEANSITGPFSVISCAVKSSDGNYSASTPNFLKSGVNDDIFLTWVNVQFPIETTTHHQKAFPDNDLTARISNNPLEGQIPQTTGWANKNFGAASAIYEQGYYYLFYEGADNFTCDGQWGIGFSRTTNIYDKNSWVQSVDNPLLWGGRSGSCWISYPKIIQLSDGAYYLYYQDPYVLWPSAQAIYRRKIIPDPNLADFNNDGIVDLSDLSIFVQFWLADI